MTHETHVTRYSDSSVYDEICVNCLLTDKAGMPGANSDLEKPCTKAVGNGGKTYAEWEKEDKERIGRLNERAPEN